MHATIHGERTLTELDFARLNKLPRLNLPPSLAD
ncbi:MAG: transcription elongation factor GreAB, partial [Variovorax paradoxus]|nr:transcription elongation factor GreAB [Variovorax paradoxus]